jgi:CBS domain containing-hemolysin-like protein
MSGLSGLLLRLSGGRTFTGQFFGNREEIRWLMQESTENFTTDERQMIARTLEMQGVTLRQIAVPLANVVSIQETQPLAEALRLARESGRSRLPVWRDTGTRRRIAGLLDLSTVLYEGAPDLSQPVASKMSPAVYFQDDTRLEVALRRLQRSGVRLAIVLGPDHSERGVVSLQDLMKFVFGEVTL